MKYDLTKTSNVTLCIDIKVLVWIAVAVWTAVVSMDGQETVTYIDVKEPDRSRYNDLSEAGFLYSDGENFFDNPVTTKFGKTYYHARILRWENKEKGLNTGDKIFIAFMYLISISIVFFIIVDNIDDRFVENY